MILSRWLRCDFTASRRPVLPSDTRRAPAMFLIWALSCRGAPAQTCREGTGLRADCDRRVRCRVRIGILRRPTGSAARSAGWPGQALPLRLRPGRWVPVSPKRRPVDTSKPHLLKRAARCAGWLVLRNFRQRSVGLPACAPSCCARAPPERAIIFLAEQRPGGLQRLIDADFQRRGVTWQHRPNFAPAECLGCKAADSISGSSLRCTGWPGDVRGPAGIWYSCSAEVLVPGAGCCSSLAGRRDTWRLIAGTVRLPLMAAADISTCCSAAARQNALDSRRAASLAIVLTTAVNVRSVVRICRQIRSEMLAAALSRAIVACPSKILVGRPASAFADVVQSWLVRRVFGGAQTNLVHGAAIWFSYIIFQV